MAVSSIFLVSLFVSLCFSPFLQENILRNDQLVFIAASYSGPKRVVSDIQLTVQDLSADTLQVQIHVMEDWIPVDSVTERFVRYSLDSVLECDGKQIKAYCYRSESGYTLFVQQPEKYTYFDNYGQQKTTWLIDYASLIFPASKKRFQQWFTCFYEK